MEEIDDLGMVTGLDDLSTNQHFDASLEDKAYSCHLVEQIQSEKKR